MYFLVLLLIEKKLKKIFQMDPSLVSTSLVNTDNSSIPNEPICSNVLWCGDVCASNKRIDKLLLDNFKLSVCNACRTDFPDRYTLITKTEAKSKFLLSEDWITTHLGDRYMLKDNPRYSQWGSMKLYLLGDVERIAKLKHGDLANITAAVQSKRANKYQAQLGEVSASLHPIMSPSQKRKSSSLKSSSSKKSKTDRFLADALTVFSSCK